MYAKVSHFYNDQTDALSFHKDFGEVFYVDYTYAF